MVWFLVLLVLNLSFWDLSDARHQKKFHSAVVVGTVFCDTCFQEKFSETSHFISGATVAVECESGGSIPSFREEVKTDERGEFKVHLPVSVSKHVKKIEGCSVQLIRSSEPYCAVAAAATSSSSLQLKSRKQGTHVFSAGFFTFKPLKQPNLCNQKPSRSHGNTLDDMKQGLLPSDYPGLPSPIQNPTVPNVPRMFDNLPPLPYLPGLPPLPRLPPLPPIPGFPIYPPDTTPKAAGENPDQLQQGVTLLPHKRPWKPHFFLHPHTMHRPLLFPNPFQPSPSSSLPPPTTAAEGGSGTGSPPSPPSPTIPLPFPLPPVPGDDDPSTSASKKITSP